MTFGESLTRIRKERGITRKDFAEQLQIPYTTLRNYETDQREPGHRLLIKMAALLHVSVDELIGYQTQDTKKSPGAAEATPGEDHISLEESNRLLVALGFIQEGQDLSDDDLAFLTNIISLLDTWFNKRK